MIRAIRNANVIAAMIFATAVDPPSAFAAEQSRLGSATRAEIQVGLCGPPDHIEHALALRPRGAPIKVWLFDDSALILFGHGLRLRLRVAEGSSEVTLKVADQDCARLDPKVVPSGEGKCEYDVHGPRMAGAVSLTRNLSANTTNDLIKGRASPAEVLNPSQIRYLREVVGIWPLPAGIRALGPIQVRTYRAKSMPYDVDVSQLPAGEQYVEISRKVPVADATRAMDVLNADLSQAGVEICTDQSAQAVNKLRSLLRSQ